MKKSWQLIPKVISGEKTIESRWYMAKRVPWNMVKKGDMVFFKNAGESITVKARVARVLQFDNLSPKRVRELLNQYGNADGIAKKDSSTYFELFKDKKYCILIFLEKVTILEPFAIHKKGFGAMSAWLTVKDIRDITLE